VNIYTKKANMGDFVKVSPDHGFDKEARANLPYCTTLQVRGPPLARAAKPQLPAEASSFP
jgi:hypothetical protein